MKRALIAASFLAMATAAHAEEHYDVNLGVAICAAHGRQDGDEVERQKCVRDVASFLRTWYTQGYQDGATGHKFEMR